MYSRSNQFPQSIFLTTKTSVYPNLVVPPHSDEKPINKVREAGKVTPVPGSIFGPLFHISKSEFKNEISSSALLDIQLTLFCARGVDSFLPELEYL